MNIKNVHIKITLWTLSVLLITISQSVSGQAAWNSSGPPGGYVNSMAIGSLNDNGMTFESRGSVFDPHIGRGISKKLSLFADTDGFSSSVKEDSTEVLQIPRERKGDFYIQGVLGAGSGFNNYFSGASKITYKEEWDHIEGTHTRELQSVDEINIYPAGGVSIGLQLGYFVSNRLRIQLGAARQTDGAVLEDDKVSFSFVPISISFFYNTSHFIKRPEMHLYFGGGYSLAALPEFNYDIEGSMFNVTYENSHGIHAIAGWMREFSELPFFIFAEMAFMGSFYYDVKSTTGKSSHLDIPSIWFDGFPGNGIFLKFGVGYNFNRSHAK